MAQAAASVANNNCTEQETNVRRRILIAEDDLSQQPMWEHLIRSVAPDAHIVWVTTEEAAERSIRESLSIGEGFDIVIADVFLSGKRTGTDLWQRYGPNGFKFILVSVAPFPEVAQMIRGSSPIVYIQKPLNPADCRAKLKDLLKQGDEK